MDPLSIVCGTSALVGQTAKVVKILYELHGTLKDAPLLLSSIMAECSIVRTTLCALQDMQNQKSSRISLISEQIFNSFSMAAACCELILADLEKDARTCLRAGKDPNDNDAVRRCKIILSKDHLQELLTQLRGQSQAIMFLLTTWRSRNEEQMRQHEQDNREVLRGIARRVMRRYTNSQTSSHESQSMKSFDKFDFDQELLSAPCYQRAIHYLRKMESRQTELGCSAPEPQIIGLGISCLPEDYNSTSPTDLDSPDREKQEHFANTPEAPIINVSYHCQDPTESVPQETFKSFPADGDDAEDIPKHRSFISKRRSMPPLYSQIQAVAMSPNSLLGVVARAQRHRRSRSEGTEAMLNSSPIQKTIPSPTSSTFRDSAIFDTDLAFETATKEDFNTEFDEFWVLQAYREHYRSLSIPTRKIVFLGDSCVRPLWSTVQAAPRDLDSNYDDESGSEYNLTVAFDDVSFDLHLVDMTGDHEDFAGSILEPEAHIAVIVYAIENPYSLRDVLHKWATIIQDIHPSLPMYILGWGPEVRGNARLIGWLDSMGQKPVTYDDGAAVFRHLQAEAFLEISAHNEKDASDLFEALSKTSVHLYHEELRGRTPVDFDLEKIRLSQSSARSSSERLPPKFSILTEKVSMLYRTSLLYELDATPEINSDEFGKQAVPPTDHSSLQEKPEEFCHAGIVTFVHDPEEIRTSKSDFGGLLDVQIEPDEVDSVVEHKSGVPSFIDDLGLYHKPNPQQGKATIRAPVLLRIDTGLSERYRPKLIEISKPQCKIGVIGSDEEPELPDWETYFQQYLREDSESKEAPFGMTQSPGFDDRSRCQTKDSIELDDYETKMLKTPTPTSGPSDSLYVLPKIPSFEPLTPKLMDFFEEFSKNTKDHDQWYERN